MASHNINEYKLSCELLGHSLDVRSVTQGSDSNTIISGSRDKSTKIWHKDESGQYQELITLKHHSNFISCVYYYVSEKWICTASNDSTICLYRDGEIEPFTILKGHESTVCALSKGLSPKTLISGSWDKTGKIWLIDEYGTSTFVNLKGHEAAVWAVTSLSSSGKYVTGSADKNIFFWNPKGEKLLVLKGHTDCVRGLIGLEDGSLISCGNDAILRYWSDDGDCIKELNGHSNYIYTMAMNSALGNDVLVSGSEDSSIRLWSLSAGNLGDELILPAQSVWSVACLSNGDIITGTSDGVVRVFTKDPNRYADREITKVYDLAVETRKMEKNIQLGGFNKNELPGPESLLQAGNTNGQTKMVRQPDGKIMCYQWENNKWNLIGDVLGASGGTQASSGKTLYEGKEYDYVFSVDISDTDPPIKLPYNRGVDPWLAAQEFIHKNNLPQAYLDQVANFIIKNSDTPVIQQSTPSGYQDPFTGGSRYVPGSGNVNSNTGGNLLDPFTGASSYTTTTANQPIQVNFTKGQVKHFPVGKFIRFDNCDTNKVFDKLRDFNSKVGDGNAILNDDALKSVLKLTNMDLEYDSTSVDGLLHLLKWPKDILFPVLDITRLAVRNEQIFIRLKPPTFLEIILSNLGTNVPNQLMTVRCLANLMNHQTGRELIDSQLEKIVDLLKNIKEGSANLQIALATFYLNLTIGQTQPASARQEKCNTITEGILELLKWSMDLEACYRSLQGLGNLSCTPFGLTTSAQIISVDYVMDKIRELANTTHQIGWEKINECANSLLASF